MPLYDYKCPLCKAKTNVLQRHEDPPPRCCCKDPDGTPMERQVSTGIGFELRGKGWYKDGYHK